MRAAAPPPTCRVDLRALGYTGKASPVASWEMPRWSSSLEWNRPSFLFFLNNAEAVVQFVSQAGSPSLAQRGGPGPAPTLRLHVLLIAATRGRVSTSADWPVASYQAQALPAEGGNLVVVTFDQLLLFSPSLQQLGRLALPARGSPQQYLYESPGARYLIVSYDRTDEHDPEALSNYLRGLPSTLSPKERLDRMSGFIDAHHTEESELIDLRTLRVVRSWADKRVDNGGEIANDGTRVLTTDDRTLEALTAEGVRHVFCAPIRRDCPGPGVFVGDDALLNKQVELGPGRFAMRLDLANGERVFEEPWPVGQSVWGVATSTGAKRFAVGLNRNRGGSDLLDIAPRTSAHRVLVYDLPTRRWIYALDCKKEGVKSISGLALSPDGALLALINQNGILEVFRLPPEQAAN